MGVATVSQSLSLALRKDDASRCRVFTPVFYSESRSWPSTQELHEKKRGCWWEERRPVAGETLSSGFQPLRSQSIDLAIMRRRSRQGMGGWGGSWTTTLIWSFCFYLNMSRWVCFYRLIFRIKRNSGCLRFIDLLLFSAFLTACNALANSDGDPDHIIHSSHFLSSQTMCANKCSEKKKWPLREKLTLTNWLTLTSPKCRWRLGGRVRRRCALTQQCVCAITAWMYYKNWITNCKHGGVECSSSGHSRYCLNSIFYIDCNIKINSGKTVDGIMIWWYDMNRATGL